VLEEQHIRPSLPLTGMAQPDLPKFSILGRILMVIIALVMIYYMLVLYVL
jgi:hypothetical protein